MKAKSFGAGIRACKGGSYEFESVVLAWVAWMGNGVPFLGGEDFRRWELGGKQEKEGKREGPGGEREKGDGEEPGSNGLRV